MLKSPSDHMPPALAPTYHPVQLAVTGAAEAGSTKPAKNIAAQATNDRRIIRPILCKQSKITEAVETLPIKLCQLSPLLSVERQRQPTDISIWTETSIPIRRLAWS